MSISTQQNTPLRKLKTAYVNEKTQKNIQMALQTTQKKNSHEKMSLNKNQ